MTTSAGFTTFAGRVNTAEKVGTSVRSMRGIFPTDRLTRTPRDLRFGVGSPPHQPATLAGRPCIPLAVAWEFDRVPVARVQHRLSRDRRPVLRLARRVYAPSQAGAAA